MHTDESCLFGISRESRDENNESLPWNSGATLSTRVGSSCWKNDGIIDGW